MHKLAIIVVLFYAQLTSAAGPYTAVVLSLADADTFTARRQNGSVFKVRVQYVDAPEIRHSKRGQDQPYGPIAKEWATDWLQGETVTIEPAGTSYNRIVARVKLPSGHDYAESLVSQGYAWTDPRYRPPSALKELEAAARKAKRGLWQDANPIEPREWRKQQRQRQLERRWMRQPRTRLSD